MLGIARFWPNLLLARHPVDKRMIAMTGLKQKRTLRARVGPCDVCTVHVKADFIAAGQGLIVVSFGSTNCDDCDAKYR